MAATTFGILLFAPNFQIIGDSSLMFGIWIKSLRNAHKMSQKSSLTNRFSLKKRPLDVMGVGEGLRCWTLFCTEEILIFTQGLNVFNPIHSGLFRYRKHGGGGGGGGDFCPSYLPITPSIMSPLE